MASAEKQTKTKTKASEKIITPDASTLLYELYKQVDKPKDLIKEDVILVYHNRYRINLWVSIKNDFIPNAGFISKSYFVSYDLEGLKIFP